MALLSTISWEKKKILVIACLEPKSVWSTFAFCSYLSGGAMTTVNKLPVSKWSPVYQANKQMSPVGLTGQGFLHRARG